VPSAKLGREWVPGTRLIVLRRGYRHHGIYVGGGRVIHYAGLGRHRRGRIEEVSLDDFIGNRPIHIGVAPDEARGHDIVLRARSRLDECRYDLLNNNCEHFCNWCLLGESRSQQVESLTRPIRTIVHLVATMLAFLPICALSRWGIREFLS
jgi:Lecithin retinol acyltransferase